MKKLISILLTAALLLSLGASALAETPSIGIALAGTLGDRSFYDSAYAGIQALKADLGTEIFYQECKEDGSLYATALYDLADEADIVAAVGWQFCDALLEVPQEIPEKKFLFIDNVNEVIPENMMCVVYAQNEGSFLVGYIAGKLTATGKIGVVGGENVDTINDFIVGYKAGAAYANPEIEVQVQYANDYEDPAKGKNCAMALYSGGCDIVYAVAGKTGEGVFEAAAETGHYAIGVDSDQKYINPEVIICSCVKEVGKSIYSIVSGESAFAGGTTWKADMANGFIDVAYGTADMTQQVSDELKAEVEEIKAKIIAGEIEVPTALK